MENLLTICYIADYIFYILLHWLRAYKSHFHNNKTYSVVGKGHLYFRFRIHWLETSKAEVMIKRDSCQLKVEQTCHKGQRLFNFVTSVLRPYALPDLSHTLIHIAHRTHTHHVPSSHIHLVECRHLYIYTHTHTHTHTHTQPFHGTHIHVHAQTHAPSIAHAPGLDQGRANTYELSMSP